MQDTALDLIDHLLVQLGITLLQDPAKGSLRPEDSPRGRGKYTSRVHEFI
jgi:hypothetical protein